MADYSPYDLPTENVLSEPAVAYSTHKHQSVVHVLELKQAGQEGNGDLAWIDLARGGLSKSSIARVGAYLDLTVEELCALLHISTRTWQRKAAHELWDGDVAEHGLELAELVAKGIEVLGSIAALRVWVRSPLRALGQRTPLSILDYLRGIRMCMDLLGRIEHGVYS